MVCSGLPWPEPKTRRWPWNLGARAMVDSSLVILWGVGRGRRIISEKSSGAIDKKHFGCVSEYFVDCGKHAGSWHEALGTAKEKRG